MILGSKPKFARALSRSALGIALALGVAASGVLTAETALAQKQKAPKLTPAFQKVAAPVVQSVEAAKARADVTAAKGNPAALGTALAAEKSQVEQVFAAATSPQDKFLAGQLGVQLGGLAEDPALQRRGLQAMIDSGTAEPAEAAKYQFYVGQIAYQAKDYAAARTALQAAISGGFRDSDADALLAESYLNDNQTAQGLTVLKQSIDARSAAGTPAPEAWYRRGLGAAYKAKQLDQAAGFSMALVQAYPTLQNWGGAITVVREIGQFPAQETLDLMRLMGRTGSYAEERDYIEYLQAADARRLPGEALKVIEAGIAAGKLKASDPFVTENRQIASQRVGQDRASLVALERDARAASATGATVSGAADAFLSYGEAAKAEELYTIALGKSGVDAARAQTRLGIAQVDQGKYGPAQENFAKVTTGPRKSIAQLWAIYAAQKASGGQAPAAPAKPAG